MTTWRWLEWRILKELLVSWESKGYTLQASSPDKGIDMVVQQGSQVLILQVKNWTDRRAQRPIPQPDDLRRQYAVEDVQLDVVWQPVTRLVAVEDIESRIAQATEIAAQQAEAAYLLAFATLEAAVLRLVSTADILPKQLVMNELAVVAREAGLVTEEEFVRIADTSELRNRIAHGVFDSQDITASDVDGLVGLTRKLARSVPSQAATLLDAACVQASRRPGLPSGGMIAKHLPKRSRQPDAQAIDYALVVLEHVAGGSSGRSRSTFED